MAKRVLEVLLVSPSECGEFHLTEKSKSNLQRIYGVAEGVQIKPVSFDNLQRLHDIAEAEADRDILAIHPCLMGNLLDLACANVISSSSKPIIMPIGDDWIQIVLNKL